MPDSVFGVTLGRIRDHCQVSRQESVSITFHGGEPCLLGVRRFDAWCKYATAILRGTATVDFAIQTNATLLDEEWAETFAKHQVAVGISIDGPQEVHDRSRIDHRGRGSYEAALTGLAALRRARVPFGILAVIQFGLDPIAVHRHLLSLGCESISYLAPDFTHDTIAPVRERYGPTPCADVWLPLFDEWWFNGTLDVRIADFWNIARVIMGGNSELENIGNRPTSYVFVEADGEIEGLDVLRVCREGMSKTGLHVHAAALSEIAQAGLLHRQIIFEGMTLPDACQACAERNTCSGGYFPHRYSSDRGFNNPSVWCADILKLFALVRKRLNVSVPETMLRRRRLGRARHS